jgi:hypothetical protein
MCALRDDAVMTQFCACADRSRAAGRSRRAAVSRCYGVTGCVPQSPPPSSRSDVFVTWKSPLPSALTV